jgi:hypothetical protein
VLEKTDNSGPRVMITKNNSSKDNRKSWFIYNPDFLKAEYNVLVLDGMTGKLKEHITVPFVKDGF